MAARTLVRCSTILVSQPGRSFSTSTFPSALRSRLRVSRGCSSVFPLRCSHGDATSSDEQSPPPTSSDEQSPPPTSSDEQSPPQEAVLKAISEVSKLEGREAQTTNIVMGGTVTDDSTNEWIDLDKKVNSYPTVRGFTAIGVGGDDFVQSMVVAVESVLQEPVPKGQVSLKLSSEGKYVSVKIGPIRVVSSEQVQAVYNAMRRDNRMKYFL